jgi:hypothetical protein
MPGSATPKTVAWGARRLGAGGAGAGAFGGGARGLPLERPSIVPRNDGPEVAEGAATAGVGGRGWGGASAGGGGIAAAPNPIMVIFESGAATDFGIGAGPITAPHWAQKRAPAGAGWPH